MNSFTKGLITGVFGVVVGLVISGSNYQDDYGIGKYQISTTATSSWIYETILDTRSGRVISKKRFNYDEFKRD